MEQELQRIKAEALDAIKDAADQQALQDIRVKYLGKKGEVTALLKGLGKLSPEERPKAGALVNAVREALEAEIDTVKVRMETAELNARLEQERIDITLPGRAQKAGHIHPLTKVNEMIEDFFMKMGYTVEEGPEIEQDYFNFECLNLPKDHPARDMQDSFYITENFLLRTHTSPVQARTMQRHEPNSPIRMIAPGKVYRWDYDATHSPVFHQVEGLIIDEHITFADLIKAVVEKFKASANFFKNAKLAISFEGRHLSDEEQQQIIAAIEENTTIEILCIVESGTEQEAIMKEQVEAFNEAVQKQCENVATVSVPEQFYRGTLRSGQVITSESSVTIIGDVNPGAKIIAQGNIVILGALKGNVHAGCTGDRSCFVFALDMQPIQIQIGDLIAKSPDEPQPKHRVRRKEKPAQEQAQIAIAKDGYIYIEPITKNILNSI